MSNIDTLREHLFSTLQGLKDGSIDADKAKVMGEVSQVIINSAKVEVDFIKANGGGRSNFITANPNQQITNTPTGQKVVNGATTIHKIR